MFGVQLAKDAEFMKGDGVLGFGRDENGNCNLLDQLKDNNVINRKLVTLSLKNTDEESKIIIGGIPRLMDPLNITWTPLESPHDWSVKLYQMDFN